MREKQNKVQKNIDNKKKKNILVSSQRETISSDNLLFFGDNRYPNNLMTTYPKYFLDSNSINKNTTLVQLSKLISEVETNADAKSDFDKENFSNYYFGNTQEEIIEQLA